MDPRAGALTSLALVSLAYSTETNGNFTTVYGSVVTDYYPSTTADGPYGYTSSAASPSGEVGSVTTITPIDQGAAPSNAWTVATCPDPP
ncbi:MAG: hypothetical protein ABSF83_12290 [Nitrososphaerales archaeon]|jgi:hypothetical protein